MQIAKILEAKGDDVATISRSATITEALSELAFRGVGALVVSEDASTPEGIISERDIVRALHLAGPEVVDRPVGEAMTELIHTCAPEDDIEELMAVMTDLRVRHLPVVVDGQLAGIVSIGDVVKARIDQLERDRSELVEYISAR
jgi:CBS domain-containing protein